MMNTTVSTDEDENLYSRGEAIVLAWIPRLTGTLSAIGSAAIIYMILSNWEKKIAKPSHRLMLSMSILDVIQSLAFIISSTAIPETPNNPGTIGTDNTCIAQGFFMVVGLGVPMLNTSLNIMYLLLIRYRVNKQRFAATVEPFMHISSIVVPLVIATISVSADLIVPGVNACYVSFGSPNKILFVIASLLAACFLISSCSLILVCMFIIEQIDKMKKYSYGSNHIQSMMTEKRETIIQVCLYTFAFLLTFIMPGVIFLITRSNEGFFFSMEVMKAVLYPLQGFWNFLFYIRLGIKKRRKEFPDKCIIGIIFDIVFNEHVSSNQTNNNTRTKRCLNVFSPKWSSLKMLSLKVFNPKKLFSSGKSKVIRDDNNKDIIQVRFEELESNIPVDNLDKDESGHPCKVGEMKTSVLDFNSYHPPQASLMVIDEFSNTVSNTVSNTGLDRSVGNQLPTLQLSNMTITSDEEDLQEKTSDVENQKENGDIRAGIFISKRRRSSLLSFATVEADYLFHDELELVGEYDRCKQEV